MNPLAGPLLMVASMAGFAAEDALIKALSARVPVGQIALLLGAGGITIFGGLAALRGQGIWTLQALRGRVLLRNAAEACAVVFMMMGLALTPLSLVSSVLQAMPLMVTFAAAVFLGEPVGWRRWSAILVGFVGVLMIVRPGLSGFDPYALLPLGAVVMLTIRDLATNRLPAGVTSFQISGWGFAATIPGGFLMLAMRGDGVMMPATADWLLLGSTLLAGIVGYTTLVLATRTGDIALTTSFRYSRLVFGMAIGVIWFGERPDALMLAGAVLVVVAGLYTVMRELRLRRAPRRAPRPVA